MANRHEKTYVTDVASIFITTHPFTVQTVLCQKKYSCLLKNEQIKHTQTEN